jgi:3-oxoacyl-[acyl-carrier-protein] synthase-3
MEVVDGFLTAGTARYGLVVASDAHPGRGLADVFPYSPIGAAALLRSDDAHDGLAAFRTETHPGFEDQYRAHVRWEQRRRRRPRRSTGGRNVLVIDEHPDYGRRRAGCAASTIRQFLDNAHIAPADLDLVVTNETGDDLTALANQLELAVGTFATPDAELGRAHTAGLLVALAGARADGRWADAETGLLVATGAGITVACGLYRTNPATRSPTSSSAGHAPSVVFCCSK